MWERFVPDLRFDSVFDVPYGDLYESGYRGLIFDIDNTLVPHNAPATREIIAFFNSLKMLGFRCSIVSNNSSQRVFPFAIAVGVPYACNAWKPLKSGYRLMMRSMRTNEKNTVLIGDQLFTDILGANRVGIKSILVSAIEPGRETLFIKLKRRFEVFLLKRYEKRKGDLVKCVCPSDRQ